MEREHFARGQPFLIPEKFGKIADVAPHVEVARQCAQNASFTRRRPRETEQQLDRRRLAGAVWSEETEDLSARHRHGEARERSHGPVVFRERVGANRRVRGDAQRKLSAIAKISR